jgi:xanthine/CO dehydrogenase XdhC/CoxF family maturation factor
VDAEGLKVATATVVRTERSAPATRGGPPFPKLEVVGSVTGGCVEPAVYEEQSRSSKAAAER